MIYGIKLLLIFSSFACLSYPSFGDENLSLVGTVESKASTVVVLKDRGAGKTLYLKGDDSLPGKPGYKLTDIKRKYVVYSDGIQEIKIFSDTTGTYERPSADEMEMPDIVETRPPSEQTIPEVNTMNIAKGERRSPPRRRWFPEDDNLKDERQPPPIRRWYPDSDDDAEF